MIYCISGRPRSGKSYESVVYHIIPAVKSGRKVITNVTLNIEWFIKLFGPDVVDLIQIVDGKLNEFGSMNRPFSTYEDYITDWRDENNKGPLFVIDEAHMVLPTRLSDSKILEFYSLHGHYGLDIILLTQNIRKLHRDIKDMIELTYYCAKNTAFGSDKTYVKKVRVGATTEEVNTEVRKYKPHYFPAYQSHTQSSGSVAEQMAADIKPIWQTWPFYGALVFLLVGPAIILITYLKPDEEINLNNINASAAVQFSEIQSQSVNNNELSTAPARAFTRNSFGPFNDYDLYIGGYYSQVVRRDFRGHYIIDDANTFTDYYFDVYDGANKLFTMTNRDFESAGYKLKRYNDCMIEATLISNGSVRYITCNDINGRPEKSPLDAVPTFRL